MGSLQHSNPQNPQSSQHRANSDRPALDSGSASDELPESAPRLSARTFLAVLAVCLIYFAQLFSLVGAGVQGQTIGAHFNDSSQVVWFPGSIAILTVVLSPIVSRAADYWGRKWLLVAPTLIGAVGSAVIARATSINMAIAGFCLVGAAFGAQPLLHTVASEVLPRRWRGWAQACAIVTGSLGSLVGLFMGAALNRNASPDSPGFQNYYYAAMAWFAVSGLICAVVYHPPPLPSQLGISSHRTRLAQLDWTGNFLFAAGLVLFSVGLSYSKNPYEWTDPRVSATFAVGVALAIVLIVYETRWKRDGLFHHGLFSRNRNFGLACLAIFFEGLAFFAVNSYFSFQVSLLYTPSDTMLVAVRYSFKFIFTAIFGCVAGWASTRTRRVRWITVAGFMLLVVFFAGMAASGRDSDHAVWGFGTMMGIGFGILLTTLIVVAQLSTPPELISVASGLFISVRSLGGNVGLAVYNAVFNDAMSRLEQNAREVVVPDGLPASSIPSFVAALVKRNETALRGIQGATPEIIESGTNVLLNTYVVAFRNVWITAGSFIAFAALASLFIIEEEKEFNMLIDNPIEKKGQVDSA
ncbi:putative siderophore iron transporter protein [Dichotomopilus funicola]|uniref:Siderophore iron transporter protein n=1 Tax=Dichotomopilus funicola TaxID=1934379 RepID=A0AAN6UVV0_9PEZI|nr:putative siderophore iron transporter protein [Dichotomopilus funicola]